MSVLLSTQDIYISTQQSGSASSQGSDDGFNRFRMCLNTSPLRTTDNEIGRLSLTQFSAYRNFFLVNKFNNRIYLTFKESNVAKSATIELTKQDYGGIGEIGQEFANKIVAAINTALSLADDAVNRFVVDTLSPVSTYKKGQTGTGIFNTKFKRANDAAIAITDVILQCRQYITATSDPEEFGDSYALLGGKRIGQESATANSFDVTLNSADFVIAGFFPMQRSTTQYLYMKVSEATTNLESQNISSSTPLTDSHILASSIIAKIPINNEIIGFQLDNDTPYFVELDNKQISDILFELKDHHGRTIDTISDIENVGNLFSDMTFNWSVYARGGNVHELQAPVQNFHIEENQFAQNVRRTTGSGF
jgi:hypothetical protein